MCDLHIDIYVWLSASVGGQCITHIDIYVWLFFSYEHNTYKYLVMHMDVFCRPFTCSAHTYMLQCVAVCCSVLPCVAVCCRVLQCVAVCCSTYTYLLQALDLLGAHLLQLRHRHLLHICNVWKQFLDAIGRLITVCCSVLQCVAVCCSVLQCVAV